LRSAIVTGGADFIGSHLVDSLLADGYSVTIIDDLSTGDAGRVAGEAELAGNDIAEADLVREVLGTTKPETVFTWAPRRWSRCRSRIQNATASSTCSGR
jgi:UDP-glucose 4-epimerase